jgi:hypothetical protein
MLLALLRTIGATPDQLFLGLPTPHADLEIERDLRGVQNGPDLEIRFKYASFDAKYVLEDATVAELDVVLKPLRDGLAEAVSAGDAEAVKSQAVARSFLSAVRKWPFANPSDLWWFVIYRAYCDPFNHPAQFARLDLGQSWKRTGGWALEEVLVQHYGPFLAEHGIRLCIANGEEKVRLLATVRIPYRLEPAKVDVLLCTEVDRADVCFGVVHVKASFAERRTDDQPMSSALVKAGYFSPLWTMDCKSTPSEEPANRGELGAADGRRRGGKSAKRKDFEDDGYFSACFSYNQNTEPTSANESDSVKARIVKCDFSNPADEFSDTVIAACRDFLRRRHGGHRPTE